MQENATQQTTTYRGVPLPAKVTIVGMDGQQRRGVLPRFAPELADLVLQRDKPERPGAGRGQLLRAEDVAYIAFHARRGGAPIPTEGELEGYRIHAVGGDRFTVQTAALDPRSVGFMGYPVDASTGSPETVTRLIDMGIDPFTFGDALLGVLAQRLARRLCKQCATMEPASPQQLQELRAAYGPSYFDVDVPEAGRGHRISLGHARGCDSCGGSGYRGRVAVHELLVMDEAIRRCIAQQRPAEELRDAAVRGGMRTLLQDGIRKVLDGHTDLKSVLAVCNKVDLPPLEQSSVALDAAE